MFNQAQKIADRFGGLCSLAKAIKRPRVTVYKWVYPKDRNGTDGLIPTNAIPAILRAAKRMRIVLEPTDWTPQ